MKNIWPAQPGAIIGYRRNGAPIYLQAGGAEDDDTSTATPTRLATLVTELDGIRGELLPLADKDELTADEQTRFDELTKQWDEKKPEHDRLSARAARVDAVRSAALDTTNRETGAPAGKGGDRKRTNPFENLDQMRNGMVPLGEIRSRARDAVEISTRMEDDAKEHVTRMLEGKRQDGNHQGLSKRGRLALAQHVLETGSDDYHDHFERYVEDPQGYGARAALSLTSANGGYLVPFTLDPTIILTNAGSANPFRKISNIKTTATNTWNGVSSAGVNAGWIAEGVEDTDHSPTFGNIQITPQKASAWVFGSYEVLEDSDFATQFPDLLADAKDRLEEAAFATGSGAGQPKGVVPAATTINSIGAAALAVGDVYAVQQALPARFRGPRARLAWLMNLAIMNKVRQFDTAGGSSFWANLGMDQPERLLGGSVYESTSMVGTITTASKNLLLGDFSQYLIVDRIGMSVLYEPLVKAAANLRPTGQGGWYAFWRVGADVTTTNAFRVLLET